jgi:hypothetical protein
MDCPISKDPGTCDCAPPMVRNENNECVPFSECKECEEDNSGVCLDYECGPDGKLVLVANYTQCDCHVSERVVYPENPADASECCKCEPITEAVTKCQKTDYNERVTFAYNGIVCESPGDVVVSRCNGTCGESTDESTILFVDEASGEEVEVKHQSQCACCHGVGKFVDYEVLCTDLSGSQSTRQIKILNFEQCRCQECGEVSDIIVTPAPKYEEVCDLEPVTYDYSAWPSLLQISATAPNKDNVPEQLALNNSDGKANYRAIYEGAAQAYWEATISSGNVAIDSLSFTTAAVAPNGVTVKFFSTDGSNPQTEVLGDVGDLEYRYTVPVRAYKIQILMNGVESDENRKGPKLEKVVFSGTPCRQVQEGGSAAP